jgi:uncharacterized RDD family membrane protein YckC
MNPNQPMNYALWADRVLAALIDAGLAAVGMIILFIAMWIIAGLLTAVTAGVGGLDGGLGAGLGSGVCDLSFVIPPIAYLIVGLLNKVYWVSKRGYSMGQGVMQLRVVDQDGNLLDMGKAVLRLLCTVALGFVPIVGSLLDILFPLFDEPTRQTLHDKAVGSFVIKVDEKVPLF